MKATGIKSMPDGIQVPEHFEDFCTYAKKNPTTLGGFTLRIEGKDKDGKSAFDYFFRTDTYNPYLWSFGANSTGGIFALWQEKVGAQPKVVMLDSERAYYHIIGKNFDDFLRFLSLGYREFSPTEISTPMKNKQCDEIACPNDSYREWVQKKIGGTFPRAGSGLINLRNRTFAKWLKSIEETGFADEVHWNIKPYKSVGPIRFDMTRAEAEKILLVDIKKQPEWDAAWKQAQILGKKILKEIGFTVVYQHQIRINYSGTGSRAHIREISLVRDDDINCDKIDFSVANSALAKKLYKKDPNLQMGRELFSPKYGLGIRGDDDNIDITFYPEDQRPIVAANPKWLQFEPYNPRTY